mmetsp:Transcript_4566/g.14986  ORF Transcript_4566/g.14986 Transcript_4566/m.14986 type:complete len:227 (+) Transcript_4566:1125-1805(+)
MHPLRSGTPLPDPPRRGRPPRPPRAGRGPRGQASAPREQAKPQAAGLRPRRARLLATAMRSSHGSTRSTQAPRPPPPARAPWARWPSGKPRRRRLASLRGGGARPQPTPMGRPRGPPVGRLPPSAPPCLPRTARACRTKTRGRRPGQNGPTARLHGKLLRPPRHVIGVKRWLGWVAEGSGHGLSRPARSARSATAGVLRPGAWGCHYEGEAHTRTIFVLYFFHVSK